MAADPTGSLAEVQGTFRLFAGAIPTVATSVPQAPLVIAEGLTATRSTAVDGDVVRSTAGVSIARVSLLGGFVDVHGLTSSASAVASPTGGGAAADASPVLARVTFGMGLVGARLDADGLGLNLPGFPPDVADQLRSGIDQVDAAIDTLLESLGVTVERTDPMTSVADDGTAASGAGGALVVTAQPPGTDAPLLRLRLGTTDASAEAADLTPAPPPTPPDEQPADVDDLPRTGTGGLAGVGALLAAVAVARRSGRAIP